MLETPHAIVGATIVTKIPNPIVSLPLAFASHFVLDMVPHWNPHLNTELKKFGDIRKSSSIIVAADVVTSLVLGTYMATHFAMNQTHMYFIFLGAFSGVLPDVIEGPYFFLHMKSEFIKKWLAFQKSIQVDTDIVPGLLTQLATLIACFFWVMS